jgi:hypothetical protein
MFELTVLARDEGNPPTPPGSCKVIITVSKGVQDLKPKWDELLPARVQINEVCTLIVEFDSPLQIGLIVEFDGPMQIG